MRRVLEVSDGRRAGNLAAGFSHGVAPLVAVLDVFHPGLAGGHPLVRRRQRDRSGPLVGASLGSIAPRPRALARVDRHV